VDPAKNNLFCSSGDLYPPIQAIPKSIGDMLSAVLVTAMRLSLTPSSRLSELLLNLNMRIPVCNYSIRNKLSPLYLLTLLKKGQINMKHSNNTNIPLSLAVWLLHDDYSVGEPPSNGKPIVSATQLIKPIKQIILGQRVVPADSTPDVSDYIARAIGTAIHTAIDESWNDPYQALEDLNIPENVRSKVKVNPTEAKGDILPVYKEQRTTKLFNDFNITGQYDFVIDGTVEDFKTSSVYKYINKSSDRDYILQGSIYRWLNQDIIKGDFININYIFTDWSKVKAIIDAKYPSSRIVKYPLPLLSLIETETYLRDKTNQIKKLVSSDELDIPDCTSTELWRSASVWKYYKNPAKLSRSTKNYDNSYDATMRMAQDKNVGIVKEVKGEVRACLYCPAVTICKQKDNYIADGTLKL
jgi:hypothetical protein